MSEPRGPAGDDAPFDPADDCFAPPRQPCECYCLHCQRTFMSSGMWFQRVVGDKQKFPGFWMCPTPNCDGKGFTFDIFPTDPNHPANDGWSYDDDGDCEDAEFSPDADDGAQDFDEELLFGDLSFDQPDGPPEWDPDEPKYRMLDAQCAGDDDADDIEGEEWKYGLQPGESLPASYWADSPNEWRREQAKYDQPDERPRELDWSQREDREPVADDYNEDDIPF